MSERQIIYANLHYAVVEYKPINGPIFRNCQEKECLGRGCTYPCCMGDKKECPESCQCPNNKNQEGVNDGAEM